jgi:hypothetical protein
MYSIKYKEYWFCIKKKKDDDTVGYFIDTVVCLLTVANLDLGDQVPIDFSRAAEYSSEQFNSSKMDQVKYLGTGTWSTNVRYLLKKICSILASADLKGYG